MSFQDSEAQLAVRDAKASLQQAIESLAKVVVNQVPGTMDYNSTYTAKLSRLMGQLVTIRAELS